MYRYIGYINEILSGVDKFFNKIKWKNIIERLWAGWGGVELVDVSVGHFRFGEPMYLWNGNVLWDQNDETDSAEHKPGHQLSKWNVNTKTCLVW